MRDVDAPGRLAELLRDVRGPIRSLRRSPGLTAVAIATLTLAIGANTAIFSLLNALMLRDLPVRDPHALVELSTMAPGSGYEGGLTFPMFLELERRQQVFSSVLGWLDKGSGNIETDAERTRGTVSVVSGHFFSDLGVRPVAGRLIEPADVNEATRQFARVALLGYTFWRQHDGGDPAVVGRTLRVQGEPFTIVGVAPEGFKGLGIETEPDVTLPLTAMPIVPGYPQSWLDTSGSFWVRTTGRLRPGVTIEQARAALEAWWPELKRSSVPPRFSVVQRERFLATRLAVTSAAKGVEPGLSTYTTTILLVFAIAAVVLLIACVNLASVMVSRAAARAHEFGIRLALGAGRWRIVRQTLVEGVLLSSAGAVCGIVFASWISRAAVRLMFKDYIVPVHVDVSPDGRIVAFAAALAIGIGLLVGAVPAWLASRGDSTGLLQQGGRTFSESGRAGRVLVAAQIALTLVLVANAGLLVRTLREIRAVGSGMRTSDVFVTYPYPRPGGYAGVNNEEYYPAVAARIAGVPGVRSAALALSKPAGGYLTEGERVSRTDAPADSAGIPAVFMAASPGLFDTLGIRQLAGRDFGWSDTSHGPRAAIVSDTLARRLFGSEVAVGRHIRVGVLPRRQDIEIVGVVADAHLYSLKDPNLSAVYVPALQEPDNSWKCIVIRGAGVSAGDVRRVVASFGREDITQAQTIDYITDRVLLRERVAAMLAGFFGGLALLLAAIGLYGVMSYTITRRRREIGVRVALGADGARVMRDVLGDGLRVVLAGVLIGSLGALGTVRLVKSLLFGVTPYDPVTLAGAALSLIAVAALACALPARRAARTDPMIALRAE